MALRPKRCGDITMFSMEALDTPDTTSTLPLPIDDIASLKSGQTYSYAGLLIYVEYVKGETRTGRAVDGTPWEKVVPTAYGYFVDTVDADGEDVDVYINQGTFDPDASVFVLDQIDPRSRNFDEHKVFVGYATAEDAIADYAQMVPESKDRIGGVVSLPLDDFSRWVKTDGPKSPGVSSGGESGTVTKVASKTTVVIPTTDKAPKIVLRKNETGVDIEIYILSEFDSKTWGSAASTIIDLIESASANDTILIGISSYGGMLDLGARIASAIRICEAKVTTISLGPVASAGCLVWCEGHERLIAAGSYFMQHEASCMLKGKTSQIAKSATVTSEYVKEIIFPRAISVGLFSEEEISSMIDKGCDIYISAREAAQRTQSEIVVK